MKFPSKSPTVDQLTALHRLKNDRDFGIFLNWLELELDVIDQLWCKELDPTLLRLLQGQALTLRNLMQQIDDATETLKTYKSI